MLRLKAFTLLILFFLLVPVLVFSQSINNIDFENFRADDLSDQQIINLFERAQQQGLTIPQIERIALSRGISPSELRKLRERFETLRTQSGNLSEDVIPTGESLRNIATNTDIDTASTNATDDKQSRIFGADVFANKELTFEPSLNIPTPENYQLGPGDELIINIWGAAENQYQESINPDGTIYIDNLGPVFLSGLSIKEATTHLRERLGQIYSGLRSAQGTGENTNLSVSLGNIRSINVSVVGAVENPGTYTVPSLSSVFNILYLAGGPTDNGTFRSIKILRNGTVADTLDLYDFFVSGTLNPNTRLFDQDIIKVDPYLSHVILEGEVKRKGIFEIKNGETLNDVLTFSGGFTESAYTKRIKIARKTEDMKRIQEVVYPEESNIPLVKGDSIFVSKVIDRYTNRVEIQGAVFKQGTYSLDSNPTLFTLIQNAEGLREDAFLKRGIIYRTLPDLSIEALAFNVQNVIENPVANDISLRKDDIVRITSIFDLQEEYTLGIGGAVNKPGRYPFVKGITLEDLILEAGGFEFDAAPYNIEIARRIKDDGSGSFSNQIAEVIKVSVSDSLELSQTNIILEPFDQVFVRKSPVVEPQQQVVISGEVLFPGNYVLDRRDYRLSDLIKNSGGVTELAYVQGAVLSREFENIANEQVLADTLVELDQESSTVSQVGIRLQKAIDAPGSRDDLILLPGDSLFVPKKLETVSVRGEVLYPINVRFEPGKKFKDYIGSAGGFSEQARKGSSYVIYANGEVDRIEKFLFFRNFPEIRPGATVVVPEKPERQGLSTAERITVLSTIVSLAAIVTNTIFQIRNTN